jgi:hypothetical protein
MTDDILKELDAFRHDLGDFKEKWQDDDIWSVLDQAADKIDIDAIRIEKLEAALRDFLLWGDHCQHCDYDDEWAKIEVRARKALGGNNDPST